MMGHYKPLIILLFPSGCATRMHAIPSQADVLRPENMCRMMAVANVPYYLMRYALSACAGLRFELRYGCLVRLHRSPMS